MKELIKPNTASNVSIDANSFMISNMIKSNKTFFCNQVFALGRYIYANNYVMY